MRLSIRRFLSSLSRSLLGQKRWLWLSGAVFALISYASVGEALANMASIHYVRSKFNQCIGCADGVLAKQLLEQAVQWDSSGSRWHERLGIIYYEQGLDEQSEMELEKAVMLMPDNQRAWAALGDTYDRLAEPASAVQAYVQGGPYTNSERLIVNRLLLAEQQIAAGQYAIARDNLDQVVILDPDNLWAWTQLASPALGTDPRAVKHCRQYRLSYISDNRSGQFLAKATIQLVDSGVWTLDDALGVLQVLEIKKQPEQVALVLGFLVSRFNDERLDVVKAWVASQMSDHTQAAKLFEGIAESDLSRVEAWCRAAEEWQISGWLQQARSDYDRCLDQNAADQFALQSMEVVCQTLKDEACLQKVKNLISESTIQSMASKVLAVSNEDVVLGENLVLNADFEQRNSKKPWMPLYWDLGVWDGYDHDRAAFYVDLDRRDEYNDACSVIVGLWHRQTELPSLPYAEIIGSPISVPGQKTYLLNFSYRTDNMTGMILVRDGRTESLTFQDIQLKGTAGVQKSVVVVGQNPSLQPIYIRPQLRLWGVGAAWFCSVQVHLLEAPNVVEIPDINYLIK